ncbi:DUF6113 family protein [Streptomyces otsuchiensis]|uniref:DUF6113 family protein n=1 Tax=Streptomyces otsuchiensis TaxID=2681388 RepID=UPI001D13265C|nr:DUF6113 family protein [Streptomyces otsuchiensis]
MSAGAVPPGATAVRAERGGGPGRIGRAVAYPVLGLLGVLVAAAGSLVQSAWFPLGLLLAVGGAVGLFWGGALATRSKLGSLVPAGLWAVTVLLLTATRPQGDFVFGAEASSYLFLFGGMAAAGLCVALAPAERPLFDPTRGLGAGGRGKAPQKKG